MVLGLPVSDQLVNCMIMEGKDKKTMRITPTRLGADDVQRIQFQETTYDEFGLEVQTKTGFKKVDPNAKIEEVLAKVMESEWHFGAYNRQNGVYEVLKGAATPALVEGNTLEHA